MSAHRLRRDSRVLSSPFVSPAELIIIGNSTVTPKIRLQNESGVDPAGRYQIHATQDAFAISRALTALYATLQTFLSYDVANKVFDLFATQFRDMRVQLTGGDAAGFQSIVNVAGSTDSPAGFEFRTGDGTSTNSIRMTISIGAATADITISNANLLVANLRNLQTLRGDGTVNTIVSPNVSTDGTARRMGFYALDPATDTEYAVVQTVPNSANPFLSILAPDAAPTTSILDTNNIGFRYTPAGALVVYVNNAGAIKSLSLGTPA